MGNRSLASRETVQTGNSATRYPASAGLPGLVGKSASELVPAAIQRVLENGHHVGGARPSLEVLNQQLCQLDPRRRVFSSTASSFNVAVAVARYVWHMAGSSQLSAIAFYEPRARLFSDDGEILPGSNTGARLFGEGGGIDQVRGIVARIQEDGATRRGAAVVWRPEDAVRKSRDIPCTMAITCHLRGGELITTVAMRSNNSLRLLPYNVFEYTLLAETIAAELDVDLGQYWHTANSLHVFDDELDAARELLESTQDSDGESPPMPVMPRGEGALEQTARLVVSEAQLRAAIIERDWRVLATQIERAEVTLAPYWFNLFAVMALFAAARAQAMGHIEADALVERLPKSLRNPLLDLLG